MDGDFKSVHSKDKDEENKQEDQNMEMAADFNEPPVTQSNTHIANFQLGIEQTQII